MNIINYKEFNDSESLKKSIYELKNKVKNFHQNYKKTTYQIIMSS